MAEKSENRRMRLLDMLSRQEEPLELDLLAASMGCDSRTIRRDLDYLQQTLQKIQGLEVRRNRVLVSRNNYSPGYFTDQLDRHPEAKEAIARYIVSQLANEQAVALTAGSTPYAVAREMRRAAVEGVPPHNLIVFTNSIPSLQELVAAGISTGVLGDIYAPEDCAFHAPEFRSAFQPGIAIVGASGLVFGSASPQGTLDLFSHRAEEAAFLKQLLAHVPEIIVAVDHSKLGRRHPWSFGGHVLSGKTIHLVTDTLSEPQREELEGLVGSMARIGARFRYVAVCSPDGGEDTPVSFPAKPSVKDICF